jgi:phospholipid transport system substrate-binding protein
VNGNSPLKEKQSALEKIIDRDVDVVDVARFCLGRFWRTATPQQQDEYKVLFHKVLVTNITGKVGEYQGVVFAIGRPQPREDNISVGSIVTRPGNPPNKVDWLVSMSSGSPKIIDVVAEGTSLRLTQRSDYASYLARNNNNVQALIDAMRQQTNQQS